MRTAALILLLATAALAQSEVAISVTGNVPQPLVLKVADLATMPRTKVGTYEGVWLHEILKKAGLGPGGEQTGYVVASAMDGYRILFSLGEVDPTVTENEYLVADKVNGQPLTGRDGTFRLVVPKDVRGVRSVRQLSKLEVVVLMPATR